MFKTTVAMQLKHLSRVANLYRNLKRPSVKHTKLFKSPYKLRFTCFTTLVVKDKCFLTYEEIVSNLKCPNLIEKSDKNEEIKFDWMISAYSYQPVVNLTHFMCSIRTYNFQIRIWAGRCWYKFTTKYYNANNTFKYIYIVDRLQQMATKQW